MIILKSQPTITITDENKSTNLQSIISRSAADEALAHYKMNDDLSTTNVIDTYGNNGTAQRNSTGMSVAGKINTALHFNGVVGGNEIAHWKLNGDATDSKGSYNGTLAASTVLHSFDSITGLTNVQDCSFSVNNSTFQETAAVNLYRITPASTNNIGWDAAITEQDLSGKVVNFYLYFKDQSTVDKINKLQFYAHSAVGGTGPGEGWNEWDTLGTMAMPVVGWNVYSLDIDNPDNLEGDGGADETAIDKFRFRVRHDSFLDATFSEGDLIIDYLNYGTPMKTKNKLNEDNMAYLFTESGKGIQATSPVDENDNWSVSFWMNPNDYGHTDAMAPFTLGSFSGWFKIYTKNLQMNINTTVGDRNVSQDLTSYWGNWIHVVGTREDDTIKLYIDGSEVDSLTEASLSNIKSMSGLRIGADTRYSQYDNLSFNGEMDEIRVFSRALDLSEVKSLYNNGVPIEEGQDYIQFDTPIILDSQNHSITFWYKTDDSKFAMLFQRELYSTNSNIEFSPSNNTIRVESFTNNLWDKGFNTNIDIDDGEWHQYCLVFGPDNSLLYTDGVLTDTNTASTDTEDFEYEYIGGTGNTTYTYGQTPLGDFDDIRIYDRQLGYDEIQSLYNTSAGNEGLVYIPNRINLTSEPRIKLNTYSSTQISIVS